MSKKKNSPTSKAFLLNGIFEDKEIDLILKSLSYYKRQTEHRENRLIKNGSFLTSKAQELKQEIDTLGNIINVVEDTKQ